MARLCKMVRTYSILVFSAHDRHTEHKTRAICYLDLSRCNNGVLVSNLRAMFGNDPFIVSPVRATRISVAYKHVPHESSVMSLVMLLSASRRRVDSDIVLS